MKVTTEVLLEWGDILQCVQDQMAIQGFEVDTSKLEVIPNDDGTVSLRLIKEG